MELFMEEEQVVAPEVQDPPVKELITVVLVELEEHFHHFLDLFSVLQFQAVQIGHLQ
jgi:hypothetical protein